jgi:hypothetical protein
MALSGMPIIEPEEPSRALRYFIDMWAELSSTRQVTMGALCPISYTEIAHWARLTGRAVSPLDVNLIRIIDRAYLTGISNGD